MNQPSVLLELDYADPPPPSDLADRARARGTHLRTRRRSLAAAGVATLAAVTVIGLIQDGPLAGLREQVLTAGKDHGESTLPASVGRGPLPASIIGPAPNDPMTIWGAAHVISSQQDTDNRYPVVYVTQAGSLCIGAAVNENAPTSPRACQELGQLPEGGFAGGLTFSNYGNVPKGEAARVLVAGLVRGDVNRVMITTPSGDVQATLAPTKDVRLGQLYWAETPLAAPGDDQVSQVHRTAYRGARAVYECTERQCVHQ